jgi:hypothetical protein
VNPSLFFFTSFQTGPLLLRPTTTMFGLVTGVYQSYFGAPQLHILLVGAEESGKTALLERLKVTQFSKTAPPTPLQTPQRRTTMTFVPSSSSIKTKTTTTQTTTTQSTPKSSSRNVNRILYPSPELHALDLTTNNSLINHDTNGTSTTSNGFSTVESPRVTTTATGTGTSNHTTSKFLSMACHLLDIRMPKNNKKKKRKKKKMKLQMVPCKFMINLFDKNLHGYMRSKHHRWNP